MDILTLTKYRLGHFTQNGH